jgi:hypothetical protein
MVVILLMTINGYFIMVIMDIILMVIDGYSIGGYFVIEYWWLLMDIMLVTISGYYINGYWWIFFIGY